MRVALDDGPGRVWQAVALTYKTPAVPMPGVLAPADGVGPAAGVGVGAAESQVMQHIARIAVPIVANTFKSPGEVFDRLLAVIVQVARDRPGSGNGRGSTINRKRALRYLDYAPWLPRRMGDG